MSPFPLQCHRIVPTSCRRIAGGESGSWRRLPFFRTENGGSSMRTSNLRTASLLAILGALAACTTMGTGVGTERSGDMKANFAWKSTDDRTGTLTANLSNGDTYSGQFFQVTHDTREE